VVESQQTKTRFPTLVADATQQGEKQTIGYRSSKLSPLILAAPWPDA